MKTKIKENGKQIELLFNYEEDKQLFVLLNEPNWDITVEAFKYITDVNDKIDLITPGKLIFDMCATEYSDELHNNVRLLMSVCSTLSTKFILPINAEITDKKKGSN